MSLNGDYSGNRISTVNDRKNTSTSSVSTLSANAPKGTDSGAPGRHTETPDLLLVAANFPPSTGGIQTVMRELVDRLPANSMVLAQAQPGDRDFDAASNVATVRANMQRFHNYLAPAIIAKQLLAYRHCLPKMILCDHLVTAVGLRLVRPWVRCPYSLFVYAAELAPFAGLNRFGPRTRLLQSAMQGAHRVFVICDYMFERVLDYNIPKAKITQVPMGTDFNRFSRSPHRETIRSRHHVSGKPVIGTVGRLVERKGHDQVIRALPIMLEKFPDLQYLIIGRGPHRTLLQRLANVTGVASHVHFLDNVSDDEMPDTLSALDVMVMPSRQVGHDVEGFGIVFLEAGACEVPVVGGRSGGIPSAILNGKTGLLCDPESTSDIARCILELLEDSQLSKAMGQASRQWVIDEMNWDNFARIVLSELAAPVN